MKKVFLGSSGPKFVAIPAEEGSNTCAVIGSVM
jgi:hypothetical protein